MPVDAKSRMNPVFAHRLKAHTVHDAQFLAAGCKNGGRGSVMLLRTNPFDSQQWRKIFIKCMERGQSQTIL